MLVFSMHSQFAKRGRPVIHGPEIRFVQARQESVRFSFGSGLIMPFAGRSATTGLFAGTPGARFRLGRIEAIADPKIRMDIPRVVGVGFDFVP
jgi:hypothetical protein